MVFEALGENLLGLIKRYQVCISALCSTWERGPDHRVLLWNDLAERPYQWLPYRQCHPGPDDTPTTSHFHLIPMAYILTCCFLVEQGCPHAPC